MYLTRFVFYSENVGLKSERPSAEHIKSILLSCSRYTFASGISGALIFNESWFVQVMEGERGLTTRSMLSLVQDPRHRAPVLIRAASVDERRFPGWTVGYAGHSEAIDALYLRHGIVSGFHPVGMTADSVENLLADMASLNSPFVLRSRPATPVAASPAPLHPSPAGERGEIIRVRPTLPGKPGLAG
ncbi:BLUF domain-containing protein [Methylobrevis pamukkalensis]|uniref:Sensors of blue-light using FAD n=1 Tax=Methylobrevis pamukkalensis TaxID=1439726 RepID=A0A1E3GZX2_9HYPH|nr:BLUF domain-containing protein [Methylobrevis pamukkalensis]ODN69609.1 Sensors of blue-light using FAD [Methylobrevis pamukkalensis]